MEVVEYGPDDSYRLFQFLIPALSVADLSELNESSPAQTASNVSLEPRMGKELN